MCKDTKRTITKLSRLVIVLFHMCLLSLTQIIHIHVISLLPDFMRDSMKQL